MNEDKGSLIFVKIDEYKDVLDTINLIKKKVDDAKSILGRIERLKSDEDTEINAWKSKIEEVQQKVDAIDQSLLEPGIE